MGLVLIQAPTAEPFTLAELKKDLRVDHADDDETLTRMMAEARDFLERRLQIKLMTQVWDFIIDEFPPHEIRLPFGPVQSVAEVAYVKPSDGLEETVPSGDYYLDAVSYRVTPEPWLFPVTAWPTPMDAVNAVRIRFTAGYDSGANVPGSIKAAMRLKVRHLYDGDDTTGQVESLIWNYNLLLA